MYHVDYVKHQSLALGFLANHFCNEWWGRQCVTLILLLGL